MTTMFDKQLQLRMGQCNMRRWTEELLPLVDDPSDPLGVLDLTTHTAPLDEAPVIYEKSQKKKDGCIEVVLEPSPRPCGAGWRGGTGLDRPCLDRSTDSSNNGRIRRRSDREDYRFRADPPHLAVSVLRSS